MVAKVDSAIDVIMHEVSELSKQKDGAYAERNKLVALLSKLFPSSLERHPEEDEDWDHDWRWIVFINLSVGQATWHIHDSEVGLFDHLERNTGAKWDGHTTEEKYERVLKQTTYRDADQWECAVCGSEDIPCGKRGA